MQAHACGRLYGLRPFESECALKSFIARSSTAAARRAIDQLGAAAAAARTRAHITRILMADLRLPIGRHRLPSPSSSLLPPLRPPASTPTPFNVSIRPQMSGSRTLFDLLCVSFELFMLRNRVRVLRAPTY